MRNRYNVPTQKYLRRVGSALAVALLLCGLGGGCGRKQPDFVPTASSAREALDAALTAWVNGKSVGKIETASPPVEVVDNSWWKGQRLASYEVLGEEPSKNGLYCYSVRLHLSKPSKEETVRYLVTGRSPRWVYRESDYQNSQGWGGYKR